MQEMIYHEPPIYGVSEEGVMTLAGHDIRDLMARFGSPLIVMLEDLIRANCRSYKQQIEQYPRSRVYYASKAFLTTGFCRLMEDEGMGLDVASWGELQTALAAGFPPEMILMHGNAKTREDLRLALEVGVGRIVIDNHAEIERLAELTEEMGKEARVFIRVTPGVKPTTHQYIQTGQVDSKFGFYLAGGAAEEAVKRILAIPRLHLVGLHCHIGSQIFDLKPFEVAAEAMMRFYAYVQKELGAPLDELNMGGGLGIRYTEDDAPPSVIEHLTRLRRKIVELAEDVDVAPPILCDEPGRSIVGRAGVTLYTVQSTKEIAGVRNYASVDGGMTDNPRFALYNARYQVVLANRLKDAPDTLWSISGRCCESGDMLQKDVYLPHIRVDDVVAFLSTGAYTYSMASEYNRVAKPAVVLVSEGRAELLAARQDAADLLRLDRIPASLQR
jgi:diaminopimelate decarboxylase